MAAENVVAGAAAVPHASVGTPVLTSTASSSTAAAPVGDVKPTPSTAPRVRLVECGPVQPAPAQRVRLVECGPVAGADGARPTGDAGQGGPMEWARTPAGQWIRVRSSTVLNLPNRTNDKSRVENNLGLPEFGDDVTEFYAAKSDYLPVALGYDRIVYGDHGPYVEFSSHQLCWATFTNFAERPASCYFDEAFTPDGLTKLYCQKRQVTRKPNPPMGEHSVHNNRPEGYANYLVGKFYVACESDTIYVNRAMAGLPRRKQRARRGRGTGAVGQGALTHGESSECAGEELAEGASEDADARYGDDCFCGKGDQTERRWPSWESWCWDGEQRDDDRWDGDRSRWDVSGCWEGQPRWRPKGDQEEAWWNAGEDGFQGRWVPKHKAGDGGGSGDDEGADAKEINHGGRLGQEADSQVTRDASRVAGIVSEAAIKDSSGGSAQRDTERLLENTDHLRSANEGGA